MKLLLIACFCYMLVKTGYAIQCYACISCNAFVINLAASPMMIFSSLFATCHTRSVNDVVTQTCGYLTTTGCNSHMRTCICQKYACNGPDTTAAATTLTSEPTTTPITELIKSLTSKPTTTPITELIKSGAGTIKSSIIVGSVISLLVARFIV
ncbi:uncharacterized protein LOC144428778 [Styela clava]